MEINIVIDVVCPWCYVGKRQMERALKTRPAAAPTVYWRPYQLDPATPDAGRDRRDHYRQKFGEGPALKNMRQALLEYGDELGIRFDFKSDCRIANTLDAHRVIRWALGQGAVVQDRVVEALMQAYFEDCAFLGDHDLLAQIAGQAGMDQLLVRELLAAARDVTLVQGEIESARRMGVTGVPYFIFDNKYAVAGAQPPSVLVSAMDKASGQ